jgi:hypothetical protein
MAKNKTILELQKIKNRFDKLLLLECPTYQLGGKYPNDFIGAVDMPFDLPRPDYLFLLFLGFTVVLVLKTDPLKRFFCAWLLDFLIYLIVILVTMLKHMPSAIFRGLLLTFFWF